MEGKLTRRKRKQWSRWMQAEKWMDLIETALQEEKRGETAKLCLWSHMGPGQRPSTNHRKQAAAEGWAIEYLKYDWWRVVFAKTPLKDILLSTREKGIRTDFDKQYSSEDRGGFWLVYPKKDTETHTAYPSFLEGSFQGLLDIKETWVFWDNRVWSMAQFKDHPSNQQEKETIQLDIISMLHMNAEEVAQQTSALSELLIKNFNFVDYYKEKTASDTREKAWVKAFMEIKVDEKSPFKEDRASMLAMIKETQEEEAKALRELKVDMPK